MKIGIDVGCLVVKKESQKSGVYRLAVNFLKTVARLDKKNEYRLFSFAPIEKQLLDDLGSKFRNIVARPKFGWLYFGLPLQLLINRVDVFLSLSQSLPFFSLCPNGAIFHDLAFEKFPHLYSKKDEKRLKRISRFAAKKANLIFAVSKVTKRDLVSLYGIDKSKVVVAHESAGEEFKPQSEDKIRLVRRKYKLRGDYFLFVGSLKQSKNLPNIVKAFLSLDKTNCQLVLAGEGDFRIQVSHVKKLGFVDDSDLPALYSGALGLISPSFYEGFGLPWLEAMKCGCPVIAANSGSGPEVVGKAGLLVDPNDVKQIAAAINQLAKRGIRQKLAERSIKKASRFSWYKFTKIILNQLKEMK